MAEQFQTVYEFPPFRLEPARRRLLRDAESIPLTPKAFDTLVLLVRHRDRVVDKEEALKALWPDAHVEESSLAQNVFAVRKALGDTPEGSQFVSTIPRRGYRFIATVEERVQGPAVIDRPPDGTPTAGRGFWKLALVIATVAGLATIAYIAGSRAAVRQEPSYQRLTFRRGIVRSARFAPDGKSVVYSASWEGATPRVFLAQPESPESQALDLPDADVLSISRRGELALLLGAPQLDVPLGKLGTLARVPITGGTPRPLLEQVQWADWGPDGESLAVVRNIGKTSRRLEYPIGTVLFETVPAACISSPRVSPSGEQVAFVACKEPEGPAIMLAERGAAPRVLLRTRKFIGALCWNAAGTELWYTSGATSLFPELRAVSLTGQERLVARLPGTIEDLAPDGRVLLTRGTPFWGIRGAGPGETDERELTWLEGSVAVDLSQDGRTVLFGEALEGGGVNGRIYVRGTDGSPAVRLAEGFPGSLSPDGKWAIVRRPGLESFTILPTGPGESRELTIPGLLPCYRVQWFPDGKRLLLGAEEPGRSGRLWVQDTEGGAPRPITPERTGAGVLSPDGRFVATIGDDGHFIYPVDGGPRRPLPGAEDEEWPTQWGLDGGVYVVKEGALPVRIMRVDVATGARSVWREILPSDRGGLVRLAPILTRDARAYVYTYQRFLSDLYLVGGLE
jgi:DNA-binding winged helix-turn-helix (wHTH) protein/Tol biopolymer transport system component